jgi:hypothetical protein
MLSKIIKIMTPIPLMRIENNVRVYWHCCEYIKVKKNPDFPNMCKTGLEKDPRMDRYSFYADPQHIAPGPS